AIVDWTPIEALLERTYPVGKSIEGNRAYPPILLMKCLLLQQWFRIDSDPELETQINDRISFKRFLGLSFDDPAPDHSTFSRFRGRISKKTMRRVNSELLNQFAARGCTIITEGVAGSCHTSEPIQKVYADKGYFGEPNRAFRAMNGIADGIMRKATGRTSLTAFEVARNKAIAKIRYIVEQYFGLTHLHNNASRARFTTIAKNATDALFRQFAFNLRRGTRVLAT
ncbi:MAG: transposase, partial [Spirochaetota bacterium]